MDPVSRARGFDDKDLETLEDGFLGQLPRDIAERLLDEALRLELPAGSVMHGDEAGPVAPLILVSGLLRVFVEAPDGRQVTVRYVHPGQEIGLMPVLLGPVNASAQAVVRSVAVVLRHDSFRRLLAENVDVARAVATEMAESLREAMTEIAGNAFLSVRERLGRHLLDLAVEDQVTGRAVARVTQQDLADAVASVRTVVGRALQDLRAEGIIETSRDEIIVLDPGRLHAPAPRRARSRV
jgi:CRP/FNR family transcriptional regulator